MPRPSDTPSQLDETALALVMARQQGVVSRRQVLLHHGRPNDIRRRLRRREWAVVHDGVYVDHTGPLTLPQREWAAVLLYWPAALHRHSALRAHGLRRDRPPRPAAGEAVVEVVVDARRTVTRVPGIRVERVRDAKAWLGPQIRPPLVTIEFALLKIASGAHLEDAVAVLADACAQGKTDPTRLIGSLSRLTRLTGRRALLEILGDVASGAHSVLERRYLLDVERAHGLPPGQRQVQETTGGRRVRRDVADAAQQLLVELDGQFGHRDARDRWSDLDRDIAAAVAATLTLRLGWGQVLSPCRVTVALGTILRSRGWSGHPVPCGPACVVTDRVDHESSVGTKTTRSQVDAHALGSAPCSSSSPPPHPPGSPPSAVPASTRS